MSTGIQFGTGSPEGAVTGSPGSIWSQTDGPIWRKLNGTGTSDTGWLRTDLNVFDIRDYGALCDGSNNDYCAWAAAITAAEAIDGVVFHPGGISRIDSPLEPASNSSIQFIGGPGAIIQAGAGFPADNAMLTITGSGFGSRYGAVRDLRFDGNDKAAIGLKVLAVQRQFENLDIENCTQIGLWVFGAQNCTFLSCNVEKNGSDGTLDANCWVDAGAGNNAFLRCQFSAGQGAVTQGQYNLVIRQSDDSEGFDQPEMNTFVGCQFERAADSFLGSISQLSGRNNTFISCAINTVGSRNAVTVVSGEGNTSSTLRLLNCKLTADGTATAIHADTGDAPAVIAEDIFLENFATGFAVGDTTYVEVTMPWQVGGATTLASSITSSKTTPRLVVQRAFRFDGVPNNSTGAPIQTVNTSSWLYDGTNHLIHFFSGTTLGPQWRSVDVVQQAIGSTEVTTNNQNVAIEAAGVRYYLISVNSGSTLDFTILAPTHAVVGRRLTFDIYNINGMGMITWTPGAGGFRLVGGAFTNPTAGNHILISFEYDSAAWREVSRTGDQPN